MGGHGFHIARWMQSSVQYIIDHGSILYKQNQGQNLMVVDNITIKQNYGYSFKSCF